MTRLPLIAAMAGLTVLSACQPREVVLEGERLDTRAVLSPDGPVIEGAAAPTTAANRKSGMATLSNKSS